MFLRIPLSVVPRSVVIRTNSSLVLNARVPILRSFTGSAVVSDPAEHLPSRDVHPQFHPRSDRFSSHFDRYHNQGFQSKPDRKRHNDSSLDLSSLKSPFQYTEAPELKWDDVSELSRPVRRALSEEFKYESCTPVQAAIASKIPLTNDLVVQAKTGTGKTLAFLVPSVNRALDSQARNKTKILIVSPTRELALQIGKEAERLVYKARLGVHTLVGGESKQRQVRDMMRRPCDIVVGTPGRLIDMINSEARFRDSLTGVETFILDEADRMLEIGFKEDIEEISKALPETRHTMLFSATYPSNVDQLVRSTLKPGFDVINTISDDDVGTVHAIQQSYLISPLEEQPHVLHSILSRAIEASSSRSPFKAIVFFPTTRSVELYSSLFRNLGHINCTDSLQIDPRNLFELHSRKSQAQRIRISDRFRQARSGILFTSDVSARGVDYPGINLVVQMGMPMSRDQYVHRIGRTGRAGKSGSAIAILAPYEQAFFNGLKGLPISEAEISEEGAVVTGFGDSITWNRDANREALTKAAQQLDQELLNDAFLGNLGFYQGQVDTMRQSGYNAHKVLTEMENFYKNLGLEYIPSLPSALRGTYAAPKTSRGAPMSKYGSRNSSFNNSRSYDRRDNQSSYRSYDRRDNHNSSFRSYDRRDNQSYSKRWENNDRSTGRRDRQY